MSDVQDLQSACERWQDGETGPAADLALGLAGPQRAAVARCMRERGLLHLAFCREQGADAFAAAVCARLDYEGGRRPFVAQWRRRHRFRQRWMAWTAAAAALLLLGLGLIAVWPRPAQSPSELLIDGVAHRLVEDLAIAAGQQDELRIQWRTRGLELQLAAGARVRWSGTGPAAVLHLEHGSADCTVASPAPQPLVMQLPGLRLRVLGTSWRCRATPTGSAIAVRRGRIAVEAGGQQATRSAGELVVVRRGGEPVWRDGGFETALRLLDMPPEDAVEADAPEPGTAQAGDGDEAGTAPVLQLLAERHAAPASRPALMLDAATLEPFHLVMRHRDERRLHGPGLPNPWAVHNWQPDGRSELFTDTVAGAPCLVLRNVAGHGILLTQWRPQLLPPSSSWAVVLQYRCRGRGRLAVAGAFGDARGETVQAPRVTGDWHTAVFRFTVPATGGEREFALHLLNQTGGAAHEVLLRYVAVQPLP